MPRKHSIKIAAARFSEQASKISSFLEKSESELISDEYISWCYEYAIIRLYRDFEHLVVSALIGAINNDTSTLSRTTKTVFPKHLTDEVCKYIVIGNGYFDFKGHSGLIKQIRQYVPQQHYLLTIIKKKQYKDSIEILSVFRNYAAHYSSKSKRNAASLIKAQRISDPGVWLKRQNRFSTICNDLKSIAQEIKTAAPY